MSEQHPQLLAAGLRRVLPQRVAVATMEITPPLPPLLQPEPGLTMNMGSQRLIEFTAGRACARAALGELALPASGIGTGMHREPVWPAGVVGSISHSRRLAAAVVAPGLVLQAIGLDIEPALPLDADLLARVCLPSEIDRLGSSGEAPLSTKGIFCAKESIYKCLWPIVRTFLEFADVEVLLEANGEEFRVRGWGPIRGLACQSLAGRIVLAGDHIAAVTWIDARTPMRS